MDDVGSASVSEVDEIRSQVYRHAPFFESVKDFGSFCGVVIDQWHRPGPASTYGSIIEIARLGVRVDTSPAPPSSWEPRIYHYTWVERLLRRAARERTARQFNSWARHDIRGTTQRILSDHADVAPSTMSDWVRDTRDVVASMLAAEGMMDSLHRMRWHP